MRVAAIILLSVETAAAQTYLVNALEADMAGVAANTDPQLVAPIGLSRGITGPWWVSDSGSAVSTLYGGAGEKRGLVVNLPSAPGSSEPARATGQVFFFASGASEFGVSPGSPAFLFATLEGTVLGWPGPDVFNAAVLIDREGQASYTGVTIAEVSGAHVLYLAEARRGRIEAFDASLRRLTLDDDAFQDEQLPEGLAPFNVQQVGADVVVTYARRAGDDENPRGWVAIFDARGRFLTRLQAGRWLDAPWGVALAPHDFGELSHQLLVANHGNGQIAAFDPFTGRFAGVLRDAAAIPIHIEGLWAIAFGDGGIADFTVGPNTGPYNACYFTAAPQGHGLFGSILPAREEQTHDEQ
jgi:uncharacterized protein (TIGR03118 family)